MNNPKKTPSTPPAKPKAAPTDKEQAKDKCELSDDDLGQVSGGLRSIGSLTRRSDEDDKLIP